MYQLYHKFIDRVYQFNHVYKDRDFNYIIPLIVLTLAKTLQHVFWLLSSGRGIPKSDDSRWYLDYTNHFMKNLSDGLDMNDVLYFGYNSLLTLLLKVFKDPIAIVFIQAITASLSVILVFKITEMLFNRKTALIASVFYCFMWEVTLWSTYILSDSFFVSLLLLCVFFLLKTLESHQRRYKILFVLTSLYMVVFRPAGVVTMFVMLIYIAIRLDRKKVINFIGMHRWAIGGLFISIVTVCMYLYSQHALDPLIRSLQLNAKNVLYNVYAKGWIYDRSTAYDYFFKPDYTINVWNSLVLSFIINNWEHVFILYVKRAAAFIGMWTLAADIRTLAGMISFIGNSLPAALFLAGTIAAIRNKQFMKASILWLLILAVLIFCIVLFIDSMYRYRFPAMPFIYIVAAYGAERIYYGGQILAKRYWGMLSYGKSKDTHCNSGF